MADETSTSETTAVETVATDTEATNDTASQQEATEQEATSDSDIQAELAKWKALSRKHEESAKALREKANRYDEFEESQKTEIQKATDRAAAAEEKIAELELRATRAEVSSAKGVPADLLTGTTAEELTASADKLLEFVSKQARSSAGQSGADFSGGSGEGQLTQEQFDAYSATEKNALFQSNPTLYRRLSGRD